MTGPDANLTKKYHGLLNGIYTVPFFNAGHRDLHAKNLGSVNELFRRNF
jgi:hypothetical protein